MKNTGLILSIIFTAWLVWIILRPDPLAKFPGYASPGVIGVIELPNDGRQLLLVRETSEHSFSPNLKVRDAKTGKMLLDVVGISQVDSAYFQNDSLYLRTFNIRDSLAFTIRYGIDELQANR